MGAAVYADRAFVSFQGIELVNIQRSSLRQDFGGKPVETMTNDRFNRGFLLGNRKITIGLTLATEQTLARPKLDGIDFTAQDYAVTYVVGANLWVATGLFPIDATDDNGGVGAEATFAINLGATRIVDAAGNPVDFNIALGNPNVPGG